MTKNYQDAIDSLLAKVAAEDDPAVAARLAEVAINLTHAANQAADRAAITDDSRVSERLEAALKATTIGVDKGIADAQANNGSAGD